ncbi:MAG TPA: hypothetical protein PKM36_00505 [Propionibacteriaceae bacterium]|nr:hypothetical protein [Propionibacteriaceae bacterium]
MSGVLLVPLTREEWAMLREGRTLSSHDAYAPTAALGETFDLEELEEVERAALLVASVASLLASGERLVASVEAAFDVDHESHLGKAHVAGLTMADVGAYFIDGPEAADAVAAAVAATPGLDLDTAWETAEVQALLEHDLLWHGPTEPLPVPA